MTSKDTGVDDGIGKCKVSLRRYAKGNSYAASSKHVCAEYDERGPRMAPLLQARSGRNQHHGRALQFTRQRYVTNLLSIKFSRLHGKARSVNMVTSFAPESLSQKSFEIDQFSNEKRLS